MIDPILFGILMIIPVAWILAMFMVLSIATLVVVLGIITLVCEKIIHLAFKEEI